METKALSRPIPAGTDSQLRLRAAATTARHVESETGPGIISRIGLRCSSQAARPARHCHPGAGRAAAGFVLAAAALAHPTAAATARATLAHQRVDK